MATAETQARPAESTPAGTPSRWLRNPGTALELDWVRDLRINRSAVERRAATIGKRRSVFVRSVEVKVADTIGAGDTFSAAVLARLNSGGKLDKRAVKSLSESELTDVLAYAAKAAAITASRPGADPPWLREMQ